MTTYTLDSGASNVACIDSTVAAKIASTVDNYDNLINDAAQASIEERRMGVMQSIWSHPKAVLFSMGISLAIVMEGFDTILLNNFYAQPAFVKKFGTCTIKNGLEDCQISAPWQSGLSNGSQIGSLVGLQLVGWLSDRWGYRKTMMGSLCLMTIFILLPFLAENLVTLLMGQLLQGIPWGIFQALAVSYAADVCPVSLRPILTAYINLCWVMGQLIASGVLRAVVQRTDKWAYKIPYGLQWMWIPFILFVTFHAPESPWNLVRQGRLVEAEDSIRKLVGKGYNGSESTKRTVALLKHTNEMEKAATAGTTYWDCFRNTNLRRTEIVCMAWMTQNFCGSPFMGFSSYFLRQAGLATDDAFDLTVAQFSIGGIATIFSWFLMSWVGRRTLYLTGEVTMIFALLIIGILGSVGGSSTGISWTVGALLLVFTFIYDSTVGPTCYSIVAEIPSTRLRAKTVVLARSCFNLVQIVTNIIQPRMINPQAWNLGAKGAFVWMCTCCAFLVWTYFRLPEPKGRTYGELDVLFQRKVPAIKFKSTLVQEFIHESHGNQANSNLIESSETNSIEKKIPQTDDRHLQA